MPASSSRILVIQTAFLGDIVLTTPFLANLRELAPRADIRFLTTPAGARLLTPNDFDVTPIIYDKRGADTGFAGFLRMARRLRVFAPELVFCLHRSLRSALLAKVSGGEIYGFREAAGSALFFHRVERASGVFEAEKNQRLLQEWAGAGAHGETVASRQPVYPRLAVGREDDAEASALLAELDGAPFVAIAPSSVWATKRWPAEHFAELSARLWSTYGLRSVVVGGRDAADLESAARLLRAYGNGAPVPLNLAGKTGLGALKSVLSRAKVVVANDSAPLHMAIAMGAPVLGIFGPTTRALGFFPNAPAGRAATAEISELSCRPCGLHGHDACPLGHFRCMRELSPDLVMKELEKLAWR